MSGFDARLLVWVKSRKAQHEKIFSAVPPIADILGGLRFGFVSLQQARLLFHNDSFCDTPPSHCRSASAPCSTASHDRSAPTYIRNAGYAAI